MDIPSDTLAALRFWRGFHGPNPRSFVRLAAFVLGATAAAASTLSMRASAQPVGPPIIVQRQLQLDATTTAVRIHNLRNNRVEAFTGFGTAGGFCEIDATECATSPMAIGDVTGDGDENLVTTESTLFDYDQVVIYDQGGLVLGRFDLPNGDSQMVAAAQLSGDARAEIVVHLDGQLRVYDETGRFQGSFGVAPFDEIAVGDIDGDGFAELAVRRGSSFEFVQGDGTLVSSLDLTGPEPSAFTIGDPDGDDHAELLVVIPNVDVFESSAVVILELPSGLEESNFTVVTKKVLEVHASDLVGGLDDEVLLVTGIDPTISNPNPTGADLVVTDGTGSVLATLLFIYPPDFPSAPFPTQMRGPSRLIVGQQPYPDRDMDSLLDSWETTGVNIQGVMLDLPSLGADPDHKDLFVELDWMSDPSLPETGRGGAPTPGSGALGGFVGGTCGDGIDNDGDGNADASDADCINPLRDEVTPGACGNGIDDDGDALVDAADPDCIAGGAFVPTRAEGSGTPCADGFDNDGDGDVDGADADCYQSTLDEAPLGSCDDGLDNNGDGLVDADDPTCAMGGLTQSEIRKMTTAFCAAPTDAGVLTVPNPDGQPGIRLHLDLGTLRDSNGIEGSPGPCSCGDGIDNDGNGLADGDDPACNVFDPSADEGGGFGSCSDNMDNDGDGMNNSKDPDCLLLDTSLAETSIPVGSCSDGVDNDGDGQVDLSDSDCLVGDPVAKDGGNLVPFGEVCEVDADFYDLKRDNFDGSNFRGRVYRYGIATKCTSSGGQAEIAGNDFVAANDDAGTLMHELGHTLGLRHGGDEDANCKPNYVSVMNYDLQFGIPRKAGASPNATGSNVIYDFSGPRYPGGRGIAPLDDLQESMLFELIVLDGNDRFNQSIFTNGAGGVSRLNLNGDADGDRFLDGTDWNGDGNIDSTLVDANINDGQCDSVSTIENHTGHDDWHRINLSPNARCGDPTGLIEFVKDVFLGACLNEDGAIDAVEGPEPTTELLFEQSRDLNHSDLALTLQAESALVEVGDDLTYTLEVSNRGPNYAQGADLDTSLPERGSLSELPDMCVGAYPELSCETSSLAVGQTRSLDITIGTAGACIEGIPTPLVTLASAQNAVEVAAPDPTPVNNRARLEVETQDTTPPEVFCNAPAVIFPTQGEDEDEPSAEPISFTATAVDVCDDDPAVEIVGFDCFAFTQKGRRIDKTRSCVVTFEGATITILNSGGVDDRIEWTVQARDAVGNVGEAACNIEVERPTAP